MSAPVRLAQSLGTIAAYCGAELRGGDATQLIYGVASVDVATSQELSYVRGGQYRHHLSTTQAGALILSPSLAVEYPRVCLVHPDPYLAYAKAVMLLYPAKPFFAYIHPTAQIAASAVIATDCHIAAYAVIGEHSVLGAGVVVGAHSVIGDNCVVGAGSHLHAHVTLADETEIGERCLIHSGAVLGADGFGFVPRSDGTWFKIPQVGRVVLGHEVEIGANTTIDRAALGTTLIGPGVKLDNLIQVGHNTEIGAHTVVAACTAIAGSAKIGRYCKIAGMCAIGGHIEIADNVTITATSMVTHSIRQSGVYSSGLTIQENAVWRKNVARFHQLDQLARRLTDLEKQVAKPASEKET